MARLLIAGGRQDANLPWLERAAERAGVDCVTLLIEAEALPDFVWTLGSGSPTVGGKRIDATAAFIRYDVFSPIARPTAGAASASQAWFATFMAWAAVAGLFTFNGKIDFVTGSKLAMLSIAAKHRLRIPHTLITNSSAATGTLLPEDGFIAKPVAGGSYVMGLDAARTTAEWQGTLSPSPAIVQPKLTYPERRIYRIGPDFFAFDIGASTIDSRLDPKATISPLPLDQLPKGVIKALRRLTDSVRCDFCAVDMKTDPETGELVFLELNNGPMFMGYDQTANGTMADAMVHYLAVGESAA